jgi:hypothetical protein
MSGKFTVINVIKNYDSQYDWSKNKRKINLHNKGDKRVIYGYKWRRVNGTRNVVASFGILCGITGIIAGFFETLQGNIAPSGFVISTIGSNYIMADDFTYFAVTVIPNLLVTGILAILVSSLVLIWSVKFIDRKNGVLILLGLSITQMLVGGGWVIDLTLLTCLLATQIDKPLSWWGSHLPIRLQDWLTKLFPFSLIGYAFIAFSMLVFTILGVNDITMQTPMEMLVVVMFFPILLMIGGGFTHDVQRRFTVEP